MYKYVLNSVVKISMMSAKYFEYYTIILREAVFSWTRCMYVDVAYCYRPSSVVCRSVCQSVTLVSPAKMTEPIEMLFGLRTAVGRGNHVLDGVQIPPWEGAIL